jgi:hypothetical protein
MGKEFDIVQDGQYPATPGQLWDAVTAETESWLFPTDGMPGVDLVSERPTHHVNRMEGPDGWFNQLEQVIEARSDGTTFMRWVHSGVIADDWDNQYDAATRHTAFYLHTLGEYLAHFAGRPVVFADVQGPAASGTPDALDAVRAALGITTDTAAGDSVGVTLPGEAAPGAVLDFHNAYFIGLRTDRALYRFFGRNLFGGTVGMTAHYFGGIGPKELRDGWQRWIDALYQEDAVTAAVARP